MDEEQTPPEEIVDDRQTPVHGIVDERQALSDEIVDLMATVYSTLQQAKAPTWLKIDLTMAQFRALVAVAHNSGITVGELGAMLSIGQSSASILADHLVRRGFVDRTEDPSDRRRALLACTPAGDELIAELRQVSRQLLEDWLATLSDKEMAAMARGLRVLARAARAPSPAPAPTTTEAPA